MNFLSLHDVVTGGRFVRKLPSFLKNRVTLEEAHATLRARLERREPDFLTLVRQAIYENPASPYLHLLKLAGCKYSDLEALVQKEGVEGALPKLFRNGVYLTVNEFKGRQAARRGSAVIDVRPQSLRNPLTSSDLLAQTGGSSGSSVPVLIDLEYVRERAVNHLLALEARAGLDWVHAIWGIPGNTDMVRVLELSALGSPPVRWFSQVDPRSARLHPRYRWSARAMRWAGRVGGMALPAPEYVPLNNPEPILRWLTSAEYLTKTVHIVTWVSSAVRLCAAALQAGQRLSHVRFSVGGEPLTEARLAVIRKSGAAAVPRFMAMECGYIAYGCLVPASPDDLHIFHDMQAIIQADQDGKEQGLPANAILLSSIRPAAPFVMLNASLGDQAEFEMGSCGCPLEKLGWTRRLRMVRSFGRLTSGGMTFLDADVIGVLENVLPSRFGGSSIDYQLVEEESAEGEPRLRLRVSPSVGSVDADELVRAFLEGIGTKSGAERVMSLQWRGANFLAVERRYPEPTFSGKILHVLRVRR